MNKTKEQIAWENAPAYKNENKNQYRICYLCGEYMNKGDKFPISNNEVTAWNIDHYDNNTKNNSPSNLIAVHIICNKNKNKKNESFL